MQKLAKLLRYDHPELMPLWINVFIDILGYSILIPFLPYFSEQYNAPAWQIGLLLSANGLFSFFSGPIWGSLSDKYGRKPILFICQIGTLASFLMLTFSSGMVMLFASRILDGIFGGIHPTAKAAISDVISPKERSKEMTNIGVAHVLASFLGPGIGGLLSRWGTFGPGLFSSVLTLIAIFLSIVTMKETNPVKTGMLAIPNSEPAPQATPKTTKNARGIVLANSTARYLLTQWSFHTTAFMLFNTSISLFAYLQLGMNAEQVGIMLTLAGMVRLAVRFFVFVPLLKRLGERRTLTLGLSTFVITYTLLCFVQTPFQFAGILCLNSFGASCTRGIMNSFMSRVVKPWEQGQMMGIATSLDNFAQIIGPLAGGFILDSLPLWTFGGLAAGLALVPFLMLIRNQKTNHAPTPSKNI